MSGKLIVHGFDVTLLGGGKPVRILIDGKEVGSVLKFETTAIDIKKDCTLKLKLGLNTSKPTPIEKDMLTIVQTVAATDRLRADILRCEPYDPAKENAKILAEMRKLVAQCRNGQIPEGAFVDFECMRKEMQMFDVTPDVEREASALENELSAIWDNQLAEVEVENNAADNAEGQTTGEHRMRCNVCGHIFCYTDEDVTKNLGNAGMGAIAAIGGLAAALGGGSIFHTHHLQGQADRYTDKIVDYSRCPSCHSTDISEIKKGETAQPKTSAPTPAVSPIEEIKKYKELLDMGIITQEEFDVKKKQLLGL